MKQHDIRRLLRRNEWARVHDGVYVDDTGPLSRLQRAWAAVLYAAPAALCLESALSDEGSVIHVGVARKRTSLAEPPGVRIYHFVHLEERVLWLHDSLSARNKDFERDLDAAVEGLSTVRLSYRQVFDRPCRTAAKVAQVMRRHGIEVGGRVCGPGCDFDLLDLAA